MDEILHESPEELDRIELLCLALFSPGEVTAVREWIILIIDLDLPMREPRPVQVNLR